MTLIKTPVVTPQKLPPNQIPFQLFPPNTLSPPSPTSNSFTLHPSLGHATDIWRKPGPPMVKTFNAPLIYKSLTLSYFKRARVTVKAGWDKLYDQGGLIFVLHTQEELENTKWIKTGIEFIDSKPYVSTVVADNWADWSLTPTGGNQVTLEMERDEGGAISIYVVEDGKRSPIREVTWISGEFGVVEVWVGVYAATPNFQDRKARLDVEFEGWELEVEE